MTVPFDPKPSEELLAHGFDDETWRAAMTLYGAALSMRDDGSPRLTSRAHHKGECFAKALRDTLTVYERVLAEPPVYRMVDGDLWHREPAVMHPGDIGETQ